MRWDIHCGFAGAVGESLGRDDEVVEMLRTKVEKILGHGGGRSPG